MTVGSEEDGWVAAKKYSRAGLGEISAKSRVTLIIR